MPTTVIDSDRDGLADLALADPAADSQLDPARARLIVARVVAAETAALERRQSHRWRRRAGRVSLGVVVLALAGTGVAWAGGWLTETGQYGLPGLTEEDTSQWLNVVAPDFVDYAAGLWPEGVSLPPGYDLDQVARAEAAWQQQVSVEAAAEAGDPGGAVWQQVTGVQAGFAFTAQCAWMDQAVMAGPGSAERDQALTVLAQSTRWPVLVATDGGGVEATVIEALAAADAGDPGPLNDLYQRDCGATMAAIGGGR